MNTPTRQPPRFVPTLTEVVEPSPFRSESSGQGDALEALVAEIVEKLQPVVTRKMQDEFEQWLRATLAQHLREITARMQGELESMVRQAVLDELRSKG